MQGIGSVQNRLHSDTVVDKRQHISDANLTMVVGDFSVNVTLTAANNSAITLPPVVEATGGMYILTLDAVGTGMATISDKGNDAGFSDIYLSNAGDNVMLYSDGLKWLVMSNNISSFELFDDFFSFTLVEADGTWIENSGGDAQAVDALTNIQEGGAIRITTGDADGTTANDGTQVIAAIPVQADSGGLFMEARVKCVTNVDTMSLFVGLTDVTTLEEPFTNATDTITSTASDACGFLYDTSATTDTWWCLAVDSDTDDTGNAASASLPVADTYQVLRLEVAPDGNTIKYFVDGVLVATRSVTGVSPSTNLYATVVACATTTTTKSVDIDYIKFGHNRN